MARHVEVPSGLGFNAENLFAWIPRKYAPDLPENGLRLVFDLGGGVEKIDLDEEDARYFLENLVVDEGSSHGRKTE